jgi:fluoroquinolone resistance protein
MHISENQSHQRFHKINLSDQVLQDLVFYECHFQDCVLRNITFWDCSFENCTFESCDLSNANIDGSSFSNVDFSHSKVIGIQWQKSGISFRAHYNHCVLNYSSFFQKNLKQIKIRDCQAKEVDFAECNLYKADFTGTDLEMSRFLQSDLREADFSGAQNYSIDLQQNKVKKAIFALPEALSLFQQFEIKIKV